MAATARRAAELESETAEQAAVEARLAAIFQLKTQRVAAARAEAEAEAAGLEKGEQEVAARRADECARRAMEAVAQARHPHGASPS